MIKASPLLKVSDIAKDARLAILNNEQKNSLLKIKNDYDSCGVSDATLGSFLSEETQLSKKCKIMLYRLEEYSIAPDFWQLTILEIHDILRIATKHNYKLEYQDVLVRLLTMADWPQSPVKTLNVIGLILDSHQYFTQNCCVSSKHLNEVIIDHLKLGIIDVPRNTRAIAVSLFILAKLPYSENEALTAFSNFTSMLQFENVLTINYHKTILENVFKRLVSSEIYKTVDLSYLNESRLAIILKHLETNIFSINNVLDNRNKEVIRFNIANFIIDAISQYQHKISVKSSTGAVIDINNVIEILEVGAIKNKLEDWEWLTFSATDPGYIYSLLTKYSQVDRFFNLACPVISDSCLLQQTFKIEEFCEMATYHPKEFKEWIDYWMELNIDSLPIIQLVENN